MLIWKNFHTGYRDLRHFNWDINKGASPASPWINRDIFTIQPGWLGSYGRLTPLKKYENRAVSEKNNYIFFIVTVVLQWTLLRVCKFFVVKSTGNYGLLGMCNNHLKLWRFLALITSNKMWKKRQGPGRWTQKQLSREGPIAASEVHDWQRFHTAASCATVACQVRRVSYRLPSSKYSWKTDLLARTL